MDEGAAVIAAIAAKLALEAEAQQPLEAAEKRGPSVTAWKQAWRPSRAWTGL